MTDNSRSSRQSFPPSITPGGKGESRPDAPKSGGSWPQGAHATKVYDEMYRAIETLGRKLERSESEREKLARRLALIESSAEVDEKTGKVYLPARIDDAAVAARRGGTAGWVVAASLMSSCAALFALGLVIFREPMPQQLTQRQLAALDAMASMQLASIDKSGWRRVSEFDDVAAAEPDRLPDARARRLEEAMAALPTPATPEPEAPQARTAETAAQIAPAAGAPGVETEISAADIIIPGEDDAPVAQAQNLAPVAQKPDLAPVVQKSDTPPAAQKAEPAPVQIAAATAARAVVKQEAEKPAPEATPAAATRPVPAAPLIEPDKNLPAELAELERRAFDDVPEAQHDLGALYADGRMTKQDLKRAAYWFARAADGGVANAHYNLGVMFQQGLGVRQDTRRAMGWYESAAELGHPEAMYNLGIAYIEGVGTKRDITRGVDFFKKAANAGVMQAAYNLGVLYESNFVGPIDTKKALDWYRVAANEGHAEAREAIVRLGKTPSASRVADIEPAAGEEYGQGDASSPGDERPAARNTFRQ